MENEIAAKLFDELAESAASCNMAIKDTNGKMDTAPEVATSMATTFSTCAELLRMSATGMHEMFGDDYTMTDFIADLAATSLEAGQRMRRMMAKANLNPLDCPVIHRSISVED